MRKQGIVHLHGLLVLVRRDFTEQNEIQIPADAFESYDEYGVRPTRIADRKRAHKAAVSHLLDGLETTVAANRSTDDESRRSSPVEL